MKILLLGGAGLQRKAVLHDLSKSPQVKEVICADIAFESLSGLKFFGYEENQAAKARRKG